MPSKETPSGSCEKTGEWTALRELAAKWRDRVETAPKSFAGPHRPVGALNRFERRMLGWCADELAEALAAAAPAPPADLSKIVLWLDDNLSNEEDAPFERRAELIEKALRMAAPPPQDGQRVEPPKSVEWFKERMREQVAFDDAADPNVSIPPSKAEREVATATDGLSGGDEVWVRGIVIESSHLEVLVNTSHGEEEAQMVLRTDVRKAPPSLAEAVAGNAAAPVGEKRQPSEVQQVPVQPSITQRGKDDGSPVQRDPANGPDSDLAGQPSGVGEPRNEHELLVGGIVRAALELAILRGDLRMDNGAAFEEMSESGREDVITDTWNAMNGEGTCDDDPVKELTAIYAALAAREGLREAAPSAEMYFDDAECYYELPQSPGTMQDAIETLQSYETEVRLAAIAFAKAYAEAALAAPAPKPAPPLCDTEGTSFQEYFRSIAHNIEHLNAEAALNTARAGAIECDRVRRAAERKPPR